MKAERLRAKAPPDASTVAPAQNTAPTPTAEPSAPNTSGKKVWLALRTRAPDFHDAVMQATGGTGVNFVVNNVGGSVFAEEIRCMAFEGRLGMVGYVDAALKAEIDIEALHARRAAAACAT